MTLLPLFGFAAIALAAIAFATFTLWRGRAKGGAVLGLAIALFMLGIGGGSYWMIGKPDLAARGAQGLATHDVRGLIPFLIRRVHKVPGDRQAWVYLGRAYMTVGDPGDAAKAYARAITLARLTGKPDPDLDSAYGEALLAQSDGAMTDEAEAAFAETLTLNPKDPAARFFMGQARAQKGDTAGALDLWNGLLAETPAKTPLHQMLVDRIAMLTAQRAGPSGAPDPRVMVAGLAARLKQNPDDAAGWQRLIRAYTVLGQPQDAKAALATARKTFAADKSVNAALDAEARDLKLD